MILKQLLFHYLNCNDIITNVHTKSIFTLNEILFPNLKVFLNRNIKLKAFIFMMNKI